MNFIWVKRLIFDTDLSVKVGQTILSLVKTTDSSMTALIDTIARYLIAYEQMLITVLLGTDSTISIIYVIVLYQATIEKTNWKEEKWIKS